MPELDCLGNPPQPKCDLVVMWGTGKYFGYADGLTLYIQIGVDDFVSYSYKTVKGHDFAQILPLKSLEELMEDYLKE